MAPEPYNLTSIYDNSTSIVSLMQNVNESLMFGWYGIFILISIGMVSMFISMVITNSATKSFMVSAWIVFVISILLRTMGLVSDLVLFLCLALASLAVAIIKRE